MYFNVRVYGIIIDGNRVLLTDEEESGMRFTKFPGGGLELGEGLHDGLKREFIEECEAEVEVLRHFYTTDFYLKSVFNESQVISVYYLVTPVRPLRLDFRTRPFDFAQHGDVRQSFRWRTIAELNADDVTFPADKRVVELIKAEFEP